MVALIRAKHQVQEPRLRPHFCFFLFLFERRSDHFLFKLLIRVTVHSFVLLQKKHFIFGFFVVFDMPALKQVLNFVWLHLPIKLLPKFMLISYQYEVISYFP